MEREYPMGVGKTRFPGIAQRRGIRSFCTPVFLACGNAR